jgi:hypothetical protein
LINVNRISGFNTNRILINDDIELLNKDISGINALYGRITGNLGIRNINIFGDLNLGSNKISLQEISGNSSTLLINNSDNNRTVEIAGYKTKISSFNLDLFANINNGTIEMKAKNINISDDTQAGSMNIGNFLNINFFSETNFGSQSAPYRTNLYGAVNFLNNTNDLIQSSNTSINFFKPVLMHGVDITINNSGSFIGNLQGTAYNSNLLNNQPGSYYQPVNTAVTINNIINYNAGSAEVAKFMGHGGSTSKPMRFYWSSHQNSTPTYIWGSNSSTGSNNPDFYPYNPAHFNVNYSNSSNTSNLSNESKTLKSNTNGHAMTFNFSSSSGTPTYVWGTSDGNGRTYNVYQPSQFNVSYANNSGSASYANDAGNANYAARASRADSLNNNVLGASKGYIYYNNGNLTLQSGGGGDNNSNRVRIGQGSGQNSQHERSVAIGYYAGHDTQRQHSVSIGDYAGHSSQYNYNVAIGNHAGYHQNHEHSVAIGNHAGYTQYNLAVAIGYYAGYSTQHGHTVAIGYEAGKENQHAHSIAIGEAASYYNQYSHSYSYGYYAGHNHQRSHSIAIGTHAGHEQIRDNAIAIGNHAGYQHLHNKAIAIGYYAGRHQMDSDSIAIGHNAGHMGLLSQSIAIGYHASNTNGRDYHRTLVINATNNSGIKPYHHDSCYINPIRHTDEGGSHMKMLRYNTNTKEVSYTNQSGGGGSGGSSDNPVRIGTGSGQNSQHTYSVAIGHYAGHNTQRQHSVSIGDYAGHSSQDNYNVAIGNRAGYHQHHENNVAIGNHAGYNQNHEHSVAIGNHAGYTQYNVAVAIGYYAGFNHQRSGAVAIGYQAGREDQHNHSIAIGESASHYNQHSNSYSYGYYAGHNYQRSHSIAIGTHAGHEQIRDNAIAIGYHAGYQDLDNKAIAIGHYAGRHKMDSDSIAIGHNAGHMGLLSKSIAIGYHASNTNGRDYHRTLVINATNNSGIRPYHHDSCYINPIRHTDESGSHMKMLRYNINTKEVSYTNQSGGGASVDNLIVNNFFRQNHWLRSEENFHRIHFSHNSNTHYHCHGEHYFEGAPVRIAGHDLRCNYNVIAYYSDIRLKEKVGNIENALDKIKVIETFYFKENEKAKSFGYNNKKTQLGISAQSVQAVIPEIVTLAPFDMSLCSLNNNIDNENIETQQEVVSKTGENYLSLDYSKLVPLLIEGIKEQQKQIDELKNEINYLKKNISE